MHVYIIVTVYLLVSFKIFKFLKQALNKQNEITRVCSYTQNAVIHNTYIDQTLRNSLRFIVTELPIHNVRTYDRINIYPTELPTTFCQACSNVIHNLFV